MKSIPRRQFLAKIAASVAASGNLIPTYGQHALSPSDQVAVAVVGVGGRGSGIVKNLLTMPMARVVALCDVNQERLERSGAEVNRETGSTPVLKKDFRDVYSMRGVDAVFVATPHHWHGVMGVRAMQAGKDVYLEKPASHVFREGRLLVEAAKKYNRIAQHGTQMRSSDTIARAQEVIDSGILGEIKMAKAWNCQKRSHPQPSADAGDPPPGVDYDLWLGPAPKRPFNENRFGYNWHFYPEYGNGDIGGDGIHDIDLARWGLGVKVHPNRITAHGSHVALEGERRFPDNMMVAYHYDEGKVLLYEDRIWTPYGMHGVDSGDAVYGTEGYMLISRRGWFRTYLGRKEEEGPAMRGNGGYPQHMQNFLDCVKSRQTPNAPMEMAHLSCGLVHLGEIAYRVGRVLHFDPTKEVFPNDSEATAMLTKKYREPYGIAEPV